jgi:hypothetical protein
LLQLSKTGIAIKARNNVQTTNFCGFIMIIFHVVISINSEYSLS